MSDQKLEAEVKRLNARIGALEKLLDRIIQQKPVSEKQLQREFKNRGLMQQDRNGISRISSRANHWPIRRGIWGDSRCQALMARVF